MKTTISASEKRTWKNLENNFVSREYAFSREVQVPEAYTPAQRQYIEHQTLAEVRHAVLMPFVIEGAMSEAEYKTLMAPLAQLVEQSRQAAYQPAV